MSDKRRLYYLIIITFVVIILIITFVFNGITRWGPPELDFEPRLEAWQNMDSPLQSSFKTKLFNLTFHYKIQAKPCDQNFLAVIVVTSHRDNVETRSAMRRAFSSRELRDLSLKRVFLLGEAPDNEYVTQKSLENESKRFADIIQGNFKEAYRNLTYKHMMGLKWASENCQKVKYVIKMDDDIVVNIEKVVKLLGKISFPKNLLAGYVLREMQPIREPANKWYVTQEEFRYSKYPSFVSGWFYVTTPRISGKLVFLSHYFDYFWIDDVFVTGILAKNLRIKLYDLSKYFTVFPEFFRCCIQDVRKKIDCDVLVGPNGGDNDLFYEFNEAMKGCRIDKCRKRGRPINETCVAERKVSLGKGSGIVENYRLH